MEDEDVVEKDSPNPPTRPKDIPVLTTNEMFSSCMKPKQIHFLPSQRFSNRASRQNKVLFIAENFVLELVLSILQGLGATFFYCLNIMFMVCSKANETLSA